MYFSCQVIFKLTLLFGSASSLKDRMNWGVLSINLKILCPDRKYVQKKWQQICWLTKAFFKKVISFGMGPACYITIGCKIIWDFETWMKFSQLYLNNIPEECCDVISYHREKGKAQEHVITHCGSFSSLGRSQLMRLGVQCWNSKSCVIKLPSWVRRSLKAID